MVMGIVWVLLIGLAVIASILDGSVGVLSPAAMEGAAEAIKLSLSLAGALCLWSGLA